MNGRFFGGWRVLVVAAAVSLWAASAFAQYKWTDPQGRIVYGDNPPREARDVQRVDARGASGEADSLAAMPYESRRASQQFPVVLYTTSGCSPCDAGRQLLRARGVPYSERTVASKDDSERFEKLGFGNRLPVMTVGRQVQREFETGAWHSALDAAGYPRAAQLPRGWQATTTSLAPRPIEPPPGADGEPPPAAATEVQPGEEKSN